MEKLMTNEEVWNYVLSLEKQIKRVMKKYNIQYNQQDIFQESCIKLFKKYIAKSEIGYLDIRTAVLDSMKQFALIAKRERPLKKEGERVCS
ncbi:hypothetical protein QYF48_16250 [Brevibacillus agri]|uniref:hypothetical protein n=1 Tax=Brevibacillus agri TaxID=51101 RepID=UPI0025B73623|nr:hypothetical protein [Brevibacillus agri]MDN4094361.1 hypothetical protein [Brevibacillus agri]